MRAYKLALLSKSNGEFNYGTIDLNNWSGVCYSPDCSYVLFVTEQEVEVFEGLEDIPVTNYEEQVREIQIYYEQQQGEPKKTQEQEISELKQLVADLAEIVLGGM